MRMRGGGQNRKEIHQNVGAYRPGRFLDLSRAKRRPPAACHYPRLLVCTVFCAHYMHLVDYQKLTRHVLTDILSCWIWLDLAV